MSAEGGANGGEADRPRGVIEVQNAGHYAGLGTGLSRWLADVLAAASRGFDSFTVRFTSDREVRELNRRYRGRDGATDVLSFPGEVGPEGRHLGDVVIAVPTLRRQASARGHAPAREARLLALHGALHCLGYDHDTDGGEMERLERRLRRRFLDRPERER